MKKVDLCCEVTEEPFVLYFLHESLETVAEVVAALAVGLHAVAQPRLRLPHRLGPRPARPRPPPGLALPAAAAAAPVLGALLQGLHLALLQLQALGQVGGHLPLLLQLEQHPRNLLLQTILISLRL